MEIKGQKHKSEFNSSFGYAEDLRGLYQAFGQLRVQIVASQDYGKVPALLETVGEAVDNLMMAIVNADMKEDLNKKYEELRVKVRRETERMMAQGKFRYDVLDEITDFKRFLMQLTQYVRLAYTLQKELGKKEKIRQAIRKA